MATASMTRGKTLKTFKLACPTCGEGESITLDLNDLTVCTCGSCSDSFAPETARKKVAEQLRRWDAVCAWIALAGDVLSDTEAETSAE